MMPLLPPDIVERYEVLRHDLLRGQGVPARQWRVMTQHGLLAWAQVTPNHPSPGMPSHPPCGGGVPAELQSPVTHVLASMVLRLHPEVGDAN